MAITTKRNLDGGYTLKKKRCLSRKKTNGSGTIVKGATTSGVAKMKTSKPRTNSGGSFSRTITGITSPAKNTSTNSGAKYTRIATPRNTLAKPTPRITTKKKDQY